jgi:hypothetical protein
MEIHGRFARSDSSLLNECREHITVLKAFHEKSIKMWSLNRSYA